LKEEYNLVEEDEEVVDLPLPLTGGVLLDFGAGFEEALADVGVLLPIAALLVFADLTIIVVVRYTLYIL
jgi:hypothetical protein